MNEYALTAAVKEANRHLAGIDSALTRIADLMEAGAPLPQVLRAEGIEDERAEAVWAHIAASSRAWRDLAG